MLGHHHLAAKLMVLRSTDNGSDQIVYVCGQKFGGYLSVPDYHNTMFSVIYHLGFSYCQSHSVFLEKFAASRGFGSFTSDEVITNLFLELKTRQ